MVKSQINRCFPQGKRLIFFSMGGNAEACRGRRGNKPRRRYECKTAIHTVVQPESGHFEVVPAQIYAQTVEISNVAKMLPSGSRLYVI